MKTTDTTFKTNYLNTLALNQQGTTENENSDSISQRESANSHIFDNFNLCQKYGQSNIEKAILLLLSITLISGIILYYNINIMKTIFIKLLCIASIIDLLLLLFYCFLRIKFSSDQWFNLFPAQIDSYSDYIILMQFVLKVVVFVLSFFYLTTLTILLLCSFKFLLELYFLMNCVKMLIFCPGYSTFQEYFEKTIGCLKCENEHDNDYKKVNDDTSNYDVISGNELEFE